MEEQKYAEIVKSKVQTEQQKDQMAKEEARRK